MLYEVAVAISGASVVLYVVFKIGRRTNWKFPPGPKGIPLFGNALQLNKCRLHQDFYELSQKYGPIVYVKLMNVDAVVLCSYNVVQKAFEDEKFASVLNDKPTGFYGTYLLYGHQDVLFGPYRDVTFKLKSLMTSAISKCKGQGQLDNVLRNLIYHFRETKGSDCDPADVVRKVMAEALVVDLCGEAREGDAEVLWDFIDLSNRVLSPSMHSLLKRLPFLRYLPGTPGNLFRATRKSRDRLLERIVTQSKLTYDPSRYRGVVDACIERQTSDRNSDGTCWLTDEMINALVLDLFGGGLFAYSNTILSCLLTLLNNPMYLEKMQSEIDRKLGTRQVTPDDMRSVPMCYAVYLESLRYSSIVPMVVHLCSTDGVKFEGYDIPKNTTVWGNLWACHHDAEFWEDPWTFRPERFLDEAGEVIPNSHPRMERLIPFGIGPRKCVGTKRTESLLFCCIVTIVQNFTMLPPENATLLSDDPRLYEIGVVLQLKKYTCRAVYRSREKASTMVSS